MLDAAVQRQKVKAVRMESEGAASAPWSNSHWSDIHDRRGRECLDANLRVAEILGYKPGQARRGQGESADRRRRPAGGKSAKPGA